ncbi:MAG: winged helix-turn-helix domain-containing protein [Gammaproteobacteria bacterium]|nr:winged helix-turn-helix domain-containing protein [Gammaproteobacteria bacterium]
MDTNERKSADEICHFREFTLDLSKGYLFKGTRPIDLRSQSFQTLLYFLENPQRLISKDELSKAIWGNVKVSDSSLAHCIMDIRHGLNDDTHQLIKTVTKRGYILDCEVNWKTNHQSSSWRNLLNKFKSFWR